jgi:hypothetical protein
MVADEGMQVEQVEEVLRAKRWREGLVQRESQVQRRGQVEHEMGLMEHDIVGSKRTSPALIHAAKFGPNLRV